MMYFHISGRVKPYVRMTRRGKFVEPEALEYQASQAAIKIDLREQMQDREMIKRGHPITAFIDVYVSGRIHNHDLDNIVKAIFDAANGIVYEDDRWIDSFQVSRVDAKTKGKTEHVFMGIGELEVE